MSNAGKYKIGQRIIDKIIKEGLVSALCEGVSVWEEDSERALSTFVSEESKALLNRALRALCLTRDYVGEELLPPIDGWEWFDAGNDIANAIPDSEWAHEFRLRSFVNKQEDKTMEDYQKRVTEEKEEIDAKIERLSYFITETKEFNDLSPRDQGLLERQCDVMEDYAAILDERITRFDQPNSEITCGGEE